MLHKFLQILLLAGIFICDEKLVFGQCTPNNDPVPGIEPDTLSIVYVGVPYEQIIYFKLPSDTVVEFGGFPIALIVDSLIITGFTGLPPGFSLSCNVPSCTLLGGQNGCAAISGTASASDVGIHPLKVYVTTFVSDTFGTPVGGFPDSIDFYFLDVQLQSAVQHPDAGSWSISHTYPNPAGDLAGISIRAPVDGSMMVHVLDFSGRRIASHHLELRKGEATYWLDVSALQTGLYFLQLTLDGFIELRSIEVVR